MLFLPILTLAVHGEEIDGICYNIKYSAKTAEVTFNRNNKYSGDIFIPATVVLDGTEYTVTGVLGRSFAECPDLTSVTFPNSVASFGNSVFEKSPNLTSIVIDEENPVFDSRENCNAVIETASNKLLFGCKGTTIPNSVTTIGQASFIECSGLTTVNIPNSVTNIENYAFKNCSGLTSVTIGNGVTTIGVDPFENCDNLTKVELNSNAIVSKDHIPEYFGGQVKEYVLGEDVTSIGEYAFAGCSITSMNISESVTNIGDYAFQNCYELREINIPSGVTDIKPMTFYMCQKLSKVVINSNALVSKDYNSQPSIFGWTCKDIKEIVLGEEVKDIGPYAFCNLPKLTSVTISNSLTSMSANAFYLSSNLTDIYCYAEQVPVIHNYLVEEVNFTNVTLHVPAGSMEAYRNAELWKDFKSIIALTAQGDDTDNSDYLPFVKVGKTWHFVLSNREGYKMTNYILTNEEVVKDGKTYHRLSQSIGETVRDEGFLREEDRKVFVFHPYMKKEFLLFDYSLKEGDTFETFSYDEYKMVSYTVMSVDHCLAGPEIVRYDYDEVADSMITHRRYLRKWTVCRTDNNAIQKTWIECIGSFDGPTANLYDTETYSEAYLAYVDDDFGELYLPFSFNDSSWKLAYGCDLPTGEADDLGDDYHHQLTYELVGDRLHVHGKVFTQCGPNNYAYFLRDDDYIYDKSTIRKYHFVIQEAQPTMDCMALHSTEFYIPGFDPHFDYIIVDNQGKEHPVIRKTPQMAYHPFIEEDKVWKLGGSEYGGGPSGYPVQRVECYYFDGDTIINGKTCKQMMRQRYISPNHPDYDNYSLLPSLSYVGAWYEEDMKVYFYNATSKQFSLWYDFSLNAYDTLQIEQAYGPYVLGSRLTGGIYGFKGVYRNVMMCIEGESIYNTTWLEGIGNIDGPIYNVFYESEGHAMFLMSCTVGDEVIYLNDLYEDGATPECIKDRKRFDFTHTIKTQPKAPIKRVKSDACISSSEREMARPEVKAPRKDMGARTSSSAEEGQTLYGEYNDQQLSINLNPLDEAYTVYITDESGKVAYEKSINAGNIVGLNIDISTYAAGRYTVTVENSQESFTGQFEALTTGISNAARLNDKGEMINDKLIYNLQGQRLSSLQKGLNIVNGQKVYVK